MAGVHIALSSSEAALTIEDMPSSLCLLVLPSSLLLLLLLLFLLQLCRVKELLCFLLNCCCTYSSSHARQVRPCSCARRESETFRESDRVIRGFLGQVPVVNTDSEVHAFYLVTEHHCCADAARTCQHVRPTANLPPVCCLSSP